MAINITRSDSIIGLEEESTEGTYVAPSANTSYTNVLPNFSMSPLKDLLVRDIISGSKAMATPRLGKRSVEASLEVEMRGSGTEGGEPDFHSLLHAALGSDHAIASQNTTKAVGNTATNLEIEDADIGDYSVGDIVIVLESGDHDMNVITAVDTTGGAAAITVSPGRSSGVYSGSVVVSKSKMYSGADTGHPTLSLSYYWGNEIRQAGLGLRVSSMSLNNFLSGQTASWAFNLEGLDFTEVDGAAPHTPSYDSEVPPVLLNACIYQDGTSIDIQNFNLTVTNQLGFLESPCSSSGRLAGNMVRREITGSFNLYKDDTSVSQFTNFENNTEFALFITAYNPSSVSGEIDLGSAIGIYLPACIITAKPVEDVDGVLVDAISFQATGGTTGDSTDIFLGLI